MHVKLVESVSGNAAYQLSAGADCVSQVLHLISFNSASSRENRSENKTTTTHNQHRQQPHFLPQLPHPRLSHHLPYFLPPQKPLACSSPAESNAPPTPPTRPTPFPFPSHPPVPSVTLLRREKGMCGFNSIGRG
jgi:hypothetical protein